MYAAVPALLCASSGTALSNMCNQQGEAIAGLAAIASANKTHLPDLPLGDTSAARAEQKGMLVMLHHARLRKRYLIMLAVSACASQVDCQQPTQLVSHVGLTWMCLRVCTSLMIALLIEINKYSA